MLRKWTFLTKLSVTDTAHEAQVNTKRMCLSPSDLVHTGFQEREAYSRSDVLTLRS
jgi:hypothetical protein